MKRRAFGALTGALCIVFALPAHAQKSVASTFDARLGGFVQMNVTRDTDENIDDNPSSLRKNAVLPGTLQDGQKTLRWASTRARLFLDVRGSELWGAKTRAYTEFDWDGLKLNENTGASSASAASTPRLRRAYMRFDWSSAYLLIGQDTLLFFDGVSSAGSTYIEGVASARGGMTGGSRNRAPAFTGGMKFPVGGTNLELLGSVARHATDNAPDAGINDTGTRAAKPALETMAKLTAPLFGREALIAVSTYWGQEKLRSGTTLANRVTQDVNSRGVGLQGALPLGPVIPGVGAFEARGSLFKSSNMARWNLGNNSLTTSTPPNAREVDAKGGWAEVNWQITPKYALIAGGGVNRDERGDVIAIGGSTPRIFDNKGVWLFATWTDGPWGFLAGWSKVDTKWLVPTTSAEIKNDSSSVNLVFRYSF